MSCMLPSHSHIQFSKLSTTPSNYFLSWMLSHHPPATTSALASLPCVYFTLVRSLLLFPYMYCMPLGFRANITLVYRPFALPSYWKTFSMVFMWLAPLQHLIPQRRFLTIPDEVACSLPYLRVVILLCCILPMRPLII